ncbi:hypothetical protein CLV92_101315 [Kineococcus xinjiangensis]|uniref:Uncharacterized protein n=1 Tax=Kineococcus xinjiangensis TaxID=512762 RepID=A0A2S6IWF6_9ACTN|nr:DUF6157 family protein [Kineococcus xinjiangensis]PPK98616.1 hypothetical protein CLV92_101315 [Kineococcus xinjiangensis]
MDYVDTFITVAEDCAAQTGVVPKPRGGRDTVAVLQHRMISAAPYRLTQGDVLFSTWLLQQGVDPATVPPEDPRRAEFFAVDRACLRASPLPKTHGWGLHFDAEGRVALVAVDDPRYADLHDSAGKVVKAMRSSRAR